MPSLRDTSARGSRSRRTTTRTPRRKAANRSRLFSPPPPPLPLAPSRMMIYGRSSRRRRPRGGWRRRRPRGGGGRRRIRWRRASSSLGRGVAWRGVAWRGVAREFRSLYPKVFWSGTVPTGTNDSKLKTGRGSRKSSVFRRRPVAEWPRCRCQSRTRCARNCYQVTLRSGRFSLIIFCTLTTN